MPRSNPPLTFFENQAAARAKTALLVLYFALAVGVITIGIYAAVLVLLVKVAGGGGVLENQPFIFWQPRIFLTVAALTLLVILVGSVAKTAELSKGGSIVALLLGGRPLGASTSTPGERVLLNVVEEMSIASGVRIPAVFVLPGQDAINAFAAGLTPGDAVIAVTQGCIDKLTRDELQGVVGHEFSHILNSDMRLNLRLMGVLYGLLLIAIIGRQLLRVRGRKNPLPLLGLALLVLGYAGVWFGNLIKCAVSRQREFLADASSVQFTRNPMGIAGALKKIGRDSLHGMVSHPHAEEVSHFFFADGIKRFWGGMLSTHPPIAERLRRLRVGSGATDSPPATIRVHERTAAAAFSAPAMVAVDSGRIARSAGTLSPEHVDWARTLLDSLAPVLRDAAGEPYSARALVYCLLLGSDARTRETQSRHLALDAEGPVNAQVALLADRVKQLESSQAMALADLAIHTLRSLSPLQYTRFRATVWNMINADGRVTLFEYMLQRMIIRQLDPVFGRDARPKSAGAPSRLLGVQAAHLLSAVAYCGSKDDAQAQRAYRTGMARLPALAAAAPAMVPRAAAALPAVDAALAALATATPATRGSFIDACAAVVAVDGVTTAAETVILRVIADTLGCPIPPILTEAGPRTKQDGEGAS